MALWTKELEKIRGTEKQPSDRQDVPFDCTNLPHLAAERIASFLDGKDLISLGKTCKFWNELSQRNIIWNQIGLPQFYKLILLYFLELKEFFPNQSGQEQILFNNKDILIHGHSIFYRNWFDRGIYLVHDFLKADGKFLSYSEFILKYDLICNLLIYF